MRKFGAKTTWEEVCCPKNDGRLGIKSVVIWNKALMVHHLLDLARKKDYLWVKWGEVSWTLRKLREIVWMCTRYKIGDGKDTLMWIDNWHPFEEVWNQNIL